jgi:hypothetical protein
MQREFIITRQGRDYVMYAGLLDAAHRDGLAGIRTTLVQAPSPANGFTAICHAEVTTARGTFAALGDADPENAPRPMANALVRLAETRAKARALADATNVAMPLIEEQTDAPAEVTPVAAAPRSPASRAIPLPVATTVADDVHAPPLRLIDDLTGMREAVAAGRTDPPPAQSSPRPPTPVRTTTPVRASTPVRTPAVDAAATVDAPRPVARTGRTRASVPDDALAPRGATAAQIDAIGRLARSLGRTIPTDGLTRTAASELITQLSADRYPPVARRDADPE